MIRKMKQITSLLMIGILFSSVNLQSVRAMEPSSAKEEIIYANLDGGGQLQGTYVVNKFTDKNIVDYGDYSQVKNLTTTDELNVQDGMVTANSSSDQLYYEGILPDAQLPWKFQIRYQLDETVCLADEIAGKSGNLAIKINITKNENAKEGFFDQYALQSIIKLDTNHCRNIVAPGATRANVGDLCQLTYTILPGREKEIVIRTDVTDFEMEGIQINGIRLNLGIDSNDIDSGMLDTKVEELQEGVHELDKGANDLKDGAAGLTEGAKKLSDGAAAIQDALITLNSKSVSLTSGSDKIREALLQIQSSLQDVKMSAGMLDQLSASSLKIKEGITHLVDGLKTMEGSIDTYRARLSDAGIPDANGFADQHKAAIAALGITDTQRTLYQAYLSGGDSNVAVKLADLVKSGDPMAKQLYEKAAKGDSLALKDYIMDAGKQINIETLLKADIGYIQGSDQLIRGVEQTLNEGPKTLMSGTLTLQDNYAVFDNSIQSMLTSLGDLSVSMTRLKTGIRELNDRYASLDQGLEEYCAAVNSITKGYDKIYEGADQLANTTSDLFHGTVSLTDGTQEFVSKTSGMKEELNQEIDRMLGDFSNSDDKVASFVSDKNTKVASVQFAFKTTAIEKKEITVIDQTQEKPLNLWQKFLRIFGLY